MYLEEPEIRAGQQKHGAEMVSHRRQYQEHSVEISAQLGYEIEEETAKAVKRLAENLKNISAERIQVELVKLLVSAHPDYLRKALYF